MCFWQHLVPGDCQACSASGLRCRYCGIARDNALDRLVSAGAWNNVVHAVSDINGVFECSCSAPAVLVLAIRTRRAIEPCAQGAVIR